MKAQNIQKKRAARTVTRLFDLGKSNEKG